MEEDALDTYLEEAVPLCWTHTWRKPRRRTVSSVRLAATFVCLVATSFCVAASSFHGGNTKVQSHHRCQAAKAPRLFQSSGGNQKRIGKKKGNSGRATGCDATEEEGNSDGGAGPRDYRRRRGIDWATDCVVVGKSTLEREYRERRGRER
jgi:hypothetical protein